MLLLAGWVGLGFKVNTGTQNFGSAAPPFLCVKAYSAYLSEFPHSPITLPVNNADEEVEEGGVADADDKLSPLGLGNMLLPVLAVAFEIACNVVLPQTPALRVVWAWQAKEPLFLLHHAFLI